MPSEPPKTASLPARLAASLGSLRIQLIAVVKRGFLVCITQVELRVISLRLNHDRSFHQLSWLAAMG
jgi:hypothetical protein